MLEVHSSCFESTLRWRSG